MLRNIRVVHHDPNWSNLFQREAEAIAEALRGQAIAVHHIGSTAIPNIRAKPIIDILVVVRDIEKVDGFNEAMMRLGYQPLGENGIPGRRFFIKGGDYTRSHHVHTYQTRHPEVDAHLNFRDYLIAHAEEAQAYSRLKEALARQFPHDIDGYMAGKDAFIKETIRKAKAWRG
jgi:GrpB-like predicted nucleotidyltransferase (UPF0157 family)